MRYAVWYVRAIVLGVVLGAAYNWLALPWFYHWQA